MQRGLHVRSWMERARLAPESEDQVHFFMTPLSENEMSEFKHHVSYYKEIAQQAKTMKRAEVLPQGVAAESSNRPRNLEETKARVAVIMQHHGAVLRALKDR